MNRRPCKLVTRPIPDVPLSPNQRPPSLFLYCSIHQAMHSTYTETSSSNQRFNGNGLLESPRSPNSNWKSIFRLPNSSSKKLNTHNTSLALDTQFDSTIQGIASNTHSIAPSLTSTAHISDARSSCNSLYSQSTDSNSAATSRTLFSSTSQNSSYPIPSNQHQPTIKEVPPLVPPPYAVPTKKGPTKSEKQRLTSSRSHGQVPRPRVQTTNIPPPLGISKPPSSSRSKINTPLSPKAMGASASRFIRRVASAPNAKGLFTLGSRSGSSTRNGLLAPDDVPPVPPLIEKGVDSLETTSSSSSKGRLRPPPSAPSTPVNGSREPPAFRRTYSSNSIKVRQVEVGPSDFVKVKMLGKGDVGRVYLVREKKSSKLYAMKGRRCRLDVLKMISFRCSAFQKGNDRAEEDQARADGAGYTSDGKPPVHRNALSFISIGRLSILLYGVLYGRRIFSCIANAARKVLIGRWGQILCSRSSRRPGIPAFNGFYLPRPEAREYAP